jgi:LytS/YehU family sensor histidine kinase
MIREQVRELELKALRAQMNPHFIYNALNSIQALVLDDYPEKATMYISKFSRVLRQVLNHSERSVISLREELEALELYLQLEQLRLHVNLQYHIKPDQGIGLDSEWLPPLILQPFAENSLWHGLSRKKGEKKLEILLHTEGEWLVVEIVDNGIGREQAARNNGAWGTGAGPAMPAGKTSKGMEITGRRIREFNGEEHPSMVVTDLYEEGHPAGTRVVLRLRRVRGKKEKDA